MREQLATGGRIRWGAAPEEAAREVRRPAAELLQDFAEKLRPDAERRKAIFQMCYGAGGNGPALREMFMEAGAIACVAEHAHETLRRRNGAGDATRGAPVADPEETPAPDPV